MFKFNKDNEKQTSKDITESLGVGSTDNLKVEVVEEQSLAKYYDYDVAPETNNKTSYLDYILQGISEEKKKTYLRRLGKKAFLCIGLVTFALLTGELVTIYDNFYLKEFNLALWLASLYLLVNIGVDVIKDIPTLIALTDDLWDWLHKTDTPQEKDEFNENT